MFDNLFKGIQMSGKRRPSRLRRGIGCIGFFAEKLFANFDITEFFQGRQVAGEVAVRTAEVFFERREIDVVINHEHGHDAQPYPAFKCLIKCGDDVFHGSRVKYNEIPYTMWATPKPAPHAIRPRSGKTVANKPRTSMAHPR